MTRKLFNLTVDLFLIFFPLLLLMTHWIPLSKTEMVLLNLLMLYGCYQLMRSL